MGKATSKTMGNFQHPTGHVSKEKNQNGAPKVMVPEIEFGQAAGDPSGEQKYGLNMSQPNNFGPYSIYFGHVGTPPKNIS